MVHATPVTNNEIHYDVPPIVNDIPDINDEVYLPAPSPSEILGFYDRLDDF